MSLTNEVMKSLKQKGVFKEFLKEFIVIIFVLGLELLAVSAFANE